MADRCSERSTKLSPTLICELANPTQVNIGLRVLTRPIPAQLPEIYRTLGTDYAERVLPSIIQVLYRCTRAALVRSDMRSPYDLMTLVPLVQQESLKSVIAQYNASQLLTMREVRSNHNLHWDIPVQMASLSELRAHAVAGGQPRHQTDSHSEGTVLQYCLG